MGVVFRSPCVESSDQSPVGLLMHLEDGKMQFLIIAIIMVMASTAVAAPQSKEEKCRVLVGKEAGEGEGGKSGITRSQIAKFDDCMAGRR
jgi:hypothetical protein